MNLLLVAALLMQDKGAEETLKALEESITGAKTLSVKFTVAGSENGKVQITGSGSLEMKEGNKLNFVYKSLEKTIYDKEFRYTSDGIRIRGSYHREKQGMLQTREQRTPEDLRNNFNAGLSKAGLGGTLSYDASLAFLGEGEPEPKTTPLRWNEKLKLQGFRQVEGNEGLKLVFYQLLGLGDASGAAADVSLWMDPKEGKPVKRTLTFGEFVLTETYEEFKLNVDLPDEKFKLPPQDISPEAKVSKAKGDLASLQTSLAVYEIDNGGFPTTAEGLAALLKKPKGAKTWKGPYLEGKELPLDPWGNPYQYGCPGVHHPDRYDISSCGPDGKPGTADDIER